MSLTGFRLRGTELLKIVQQEIIADKAQSSGDKSNSMQFPFPTGDASRKDDVLI